MMPTLRSISRSIVDLSNTMHDHHDTGKDDRLCSCLAVGQDCRQMSFTRDHEGLRPHTFEEEGSSSTSFAALHAARQSGDVLLH
jgi:hypothetical protein